MEIYDTEEEQVAALKRWWKENGTSTIIGVVVGIALIGGWNLWKSYNKDKAIQASTMYGELLKSIEKNDFESTKKIADQLDAEFSSTPYASYSALMVAKAMVGKGDFDSAKAVYSKLIQQDNASELTNIARIRLIKLMMVAKEYEQGLQMLAEIDQASMTGFAASYDELKGDLYVALDRLDEARTAYQSALRAGSKSPWLKQKMDDITAPDLIEMPVEKAATEK